MKLLGAIGAAFGIYFVSTSGFAGLAFPSGPRLTTNQMPRGNYMLSAVAVGVNETTPADITVAGILGGDTLVAVYVLTTAAAIASMAQRALADFKVIDGKLNVVANAANNTNNQYLVFWQVGR